jgi:hypothetical protein
VKVVEKSRDSGVCQWGGSSGGRWRWRCGPVVLVRKREGEDDLNRGQRWQMGGSHRETTEMGAPRQEPKKRGLRWRKPARRTRRRWGRGKRSSSLGAVERRTVKRGSGQRPAAFEADVA